MRRTPTGPQFSPTDILRFLDGTFAAWMDRYYGEMGRPQDLVPDEDTPEDKLVKAYGLRHEAEYKGHLEASGTGLTSIPGSEQATDEERVLLTREAMARGDAVIFQAALEGGELFGFADFLFRRDDPKGSWHYEPWDTKLAHSVKPKFIVQLCAYAEMLGIMQGTTPKHAGAVLGTGVLEPVNLAEHWHTWLHLKAQFLEFHRSFNPDDTPPDPALEREHGQWSTFATEIFEHNDLAVMTAGISLSQMARLRAAGVITMAALAARVAGVPRMAPGTLAKLGRQARLQIASRGQATPGFEVLRPATEEPRRGLGLLPPPSAGDVYFDIEGFPYARPNGLEYLLGAVTTEDGMPTFHDWWAHDADEEQRAFEAFMDWAWARYERHPDMHIYRYSAYEVTALKRLATRLGSREQALDTFLENGVFVDLYTVVRQGVAVGTPSYSLKDIERLYQAPRTGEVVSAMGSVVAYEDWLASGEPRDWRASPKLQAIRAYNQVDCESTWRLADWLRAQQHAAGVPWVPPEPPKENGKPDAENENAILAASLRERASQDADAARAGVLRLVAALVEYHRREDKPAWWEYFRRQRMEEDELALDLNCLAGLVRTSKPPRKVKQSQAWEFAFDADQDTKVGKGSSVELQHDRKARVEVIAFDREAGLLELKTTRDPSQWPGRVHLVPEGPRTSASLTKAMLRFGKAWAGEGDTPPAVADLLHRSAPRLRGERPTPLISGNGKAVAEEVTALVRRMDHSVLCIQGPPGTGKSSVAAQVIAHLMADGKKVAITGQSHKVIINLLEKARQLIQEQGTAAQVIKVGGDEEDDELVGVTRVTSGRDIAPLLGDAPCLVGTTAWGLAYEDLAQRFDYVFIDEAGQYSLANAVVAGLSARNIILVGDQNQLPQVVQGSHPDGSDASALEHMLQGQDTVRPDFGVLLDVSWRLHPAICEWTSEAFYAGRLRSVPETATASVGPVSFRGLELPAAGLVHLRVPHSANTQASEEEADTIAEIAHALIGCRLYREANGEVTDRPLELDDILVVAPYNMQVRRILERMPGARVASVDKFQGQEAPVVIISMCASTLDEVPRGAGFLLDPNRLNVAISRAQALAIMVSSPSLLRVRCKTVEEMRLMNVHCWLSSAAYHGH